jgi:hypothetical protein
VNHGRVTTSRFFILNLIKYTFRAPLIRIFSKIDVELPYNDIDRHFRKMPAYVGYFYNCKKWARDFNKLLFQQCIKNETEENRQRVKYAKFVKRDVICECPKDDKFSTQITLLQLRIRDNVLNRFFSFICKFIF